MVAEIAVSEGELGCHGQRQQLQQRDGGKGTCSGEKTQPNHDFRPLHAGLVRLLHDDIGSDGGQVNMVASQLCQCVCVGGTFLPMI